MSLQDSIWEIKVVSKRLFQHKAFLIMFVGVVIGPLVLFVISGRSPHASAQPALIWFLSAIALLLVLSIGIGFSLFRRKAITLSINPKYR